MLTSCKSTRVLQHIFVILKSIYTTGVISKSLPVLSTKSVLRKAAVDRGLQFSTEPCRRNRIYSSQNKFS